MRNVKTLIMGLILLFVGSTCWASTLTVGLDLAGATSPETNIYSVQMNFGINGPTDWFSSDDVVWSDDQPIKPLVIPGAGTFPRWDTDSVGLNGAHDTLIFLFEDTRSADYVQPLVTGDVFTLTFPDEVTFSLDFFEFTAFSDSKDTWSLIATLVPCPPAPLTFQGGQDSRVTFAPSCVPIPGAVWLLGSGFLGLVTIRRRRRAKG